MDKGRFGIVIGIAVLVLFGCYQQTGPYVVGDNISEEIMAENTYIGRPATHELIAYSGQLTDLRNTTNITDGNIVINCAADTSGSTSPGGSAGAIQYNNGGFGGTNEFTFNNSTNSINLSGVFFSAEPNKRN